MLHFKADEREMCR